MDECLRNIHLAIQNGHRQLAAKLVSEAVRIGGYGYNFLHEEVRLAGALSLSLPLSLSLSRSGEHCSVTVTGSRTFSSLRVKSYSVLITENLINQQNWGVLSKPIEQPLDCLLEFC